MVWKNRENIENMEKSGKNQLLCFQEIPMTESHGQDSALNSAVKPLRIA